MMLGMGATLVLGSLALAVLLLTPEAAPLDPIQANLASVGLHLELSEGAQIERADVQEGRLDTMMLRDGDTRVKVRVQHGLDPTQAASRVAEHAEVIAGLFGERQAPYPGELSNSLSCPEAYKPQPVMPQGQALALTALFANERLTYGGCNADLLAFRATLGHFYDPEGARLIQVEVFSPMDATVDPGPAMLAQATVGSQP